MITATITRARIWPAIAIAFLFLAQTTQGQTNELWPEIDVSVKLNKNMRLLFSAAGTSEHGQRTDYDFGANIDFYVKPLRELASTRGHNDESKSRLLHLRVGYHYFGTGEDRIVLEATGRLPLPVEAKVSLRNRTDLRFIDGDYSWRYRPRLAIERSFAIRKYHFTPYVRIEGYYDSAYKKWSRTALTAGCVFPIRKRSELEAYLEHQNKTETSPNKQVNALGVQLNLYF